MKAYKTVYPVLEGDLRKLELVINQRLCLNNLTQQETHFLREELLPGIENLMSHLNKKPSISQVNLEHIVNELYKEDRSSHGVQLDILFVDNPDFTRFSKQTINLSNGS
jgi:hypothetical protein